MYTLNFVAMWQQLLQQLLASDTKALARAISLVENEVEGYEEFMRSLPVNDSARIIGITGPPGAGKSTIADALISAFNEDGGRTCVLCVDPSSPFTYGALLGDRIRMSTWHDNPQVFIRSLAARGNLGGLNPKVIEITEIVKAAGFSQIIIETVGVGQSEVEIAGLADVTIVVVVPESGDEIQTMKSGLMEVANIFVVNKSDRPGADKLMQNLHSMHMPDREIPIIKTVASQKIGISELKEKILAFIKDHDLQRNLRVLANRAYHLLQAKKMKGITREGIYIDLQSAGDVNIYKFIENY